jgi:hypothetical protein
MFWQRRWNFLWNNPVVIRIDRIAADHNREAGEAPPDQRKSVLPKFA